MGTRWGPAAAVAGACLGACLATGSCGGGGGAPARGFDSVQLQAIRDPTLQAFGEWSGDRFAYSVVDPADGQQSYFFLNVTNGHLQPLGTSLPMIAPGPDVGVLYLCSSDVQSTGRYTLTITSTRTGQETVLTDVYTIWPSSCPSRENQEIFVWRKDDASRLSLFRGPFDALAPVALDVVVSSLVEFDESVRAFSVIAAEPGAPEALGIFHIDVDTGASAPLVPPAADDAAWATGAPSSAGSLASATLAASPYARAVGDHFVYPRTMSDGRTVMFAGPFAGSPRELALFVPDASSFEIGLARTTTGFGLAWSRSSTGAGDGRSDTVQAWHAGDRRLVTCPLPPALFPTARQQSTAERLLIAGQQPSLGSYYPGPLLVMEADDPSCRLVAPRDVADLGTSRDGSRMWWLVVPPTGDRELWAGAADGSGARKLGAGLIAWAWFMTDTEIELALGGDLVWLDVRDDPPRLHYIAEGVFSQAAYPTGSGRWLIAGYDWSTQDQTGTLGLVNTDSGDKLPISRAVVWYWTLHAATSADTVRVVYLVRGRNPSPADGLWVASIPAAQFR